MENNNTIPKCPHLRFPEFNDEWKFFSVKEIGTLGRGRVISNAEIQVQKCPIYPVYSSQTSNKGIMGYLDSFDFEGEYITWTTDGANAGTVFFRNGRFNCTNVCGTLKLESSFDHSFCALGLQKETKKFVSTNLANPKLMNHTMANIIFPIPSLPEQKKIASFLSLLDERIEAQRQTISHLSSLSIGVYQCILSKRKERWSKVFLRDVMTIRKEKNSKNAEVHSVSVKRGILNQIEHLGRSFAAKDTKHYSLVYNGDLVYTKSPTGQFPFGIVKQSFIKTEVAVSPLYGVYTPINLHIGRIIHNFFLSPVRASSYLGTLVQKGAKNTMNITTEHFLDNTMYLPSNVKEQEIIAKFLIKLDERIEVEEQLLQKYEEQKRYLLRKMFV